MRKKSTRTKYPGVKKIAPGRFRVRAKLKDPRTGRFVEIDREIEAGSVRDASLVREELRQEILDVGALLNPQRVTVGEYAKRWASRKSPELKPSTRVRYKDALEHICDHLGHVYLDRLTVDDIVEWRDRQKLAPSTVNGRLRVLRTMMKAATHELCLARNPAEYVGAIRDPKDTDDNVLSASELADVLAFVESERPHWYPFFLTAAVTGARFGELSALQWSDIDHERRQIHIRRAQVRGHVGDTKTGERRNVPMPEQLSEALRSHRRRLVAEQAPGLAVGWVFPSRTGGLMYNSSPSRALRAALRQCEISRPFTFHGFRHAFNDLTRREVSGKVVRSITGHVTEKMTEHYSHVDFEEKRLAVNAVIGLIDRSWETKSWDAGGDACDPLDTPARNS
ncbi:MAG: tyrosine-type recombinase/integrase [Myxococcota bacterium]